MIHVYTRVSSKQQETKSQKADLERWLEVYSEGQSAKWYTDKATGKNMDRPGWTKLTAAMKSGDTILVWRLDRLGRTAKGLAELFESLLDRKIKLITCDGEFNLTTSSGRFAAMILAAVAVFETELRRERVLAGQAAAREAGKSWGGRKTGSRSDKIRKLEPQIRALHHAKTPIKVIAETLGITRPTVYSVLGLTTSDAK